MIEVLKKTLLAGVGVTVVTAEKLESVLNDFVERGKISADEAKEAADKISRDSKKEYEEAQSRLHELFSSFLQRADVASLTEVNKLRAEVQLLKDQVSKLEKTTEG